MRRIYLPVVTALVVLAGCSSSGSSSGAGSSTSVTEPSSSTSVSAPSATTVQPASSRLDPCKVVSVSELKTATKLVVQAGQASDGPAGSKVCNFFGTAGSDAVVPGVSITVDDGPVFDQVKANSASNDPNGMFITKKVAGLGDEAYSQQTRNGRSDTQTITTFAKGTERVTVRVTDPASPVAMVLANEKAVAMLVAAQI